MRSMWWQLGILGTISAFAYRHKETKKTNCVYCPIIILCQVSHIHTVPGIQYSCSTKCPRAYCAKCPTIVLFLVSHINSVPYVPY